MCQPYVPYVPVWFNHHIVFGIAAFKILSSVASPAANSAVMLPSAITSILSDRANISGSSDDTTIIPSPSSASCNMSLYISFFALISIPLVGSSSIKIFGFVASLLVISHVPHVHSLDSFACALPKIQLLWVYM